jgi:hypothetical protein
MYKRLASGSAEDRVDNNHHVAGKYMRKIECWAITRLARRGRRAEEPPRLSSTTHYIIQELGRPLITVFMSSCKRVYRRMPVAGHPFCYTMDWKASDLLSMQQLMLVTSSTDIVHDKQDQTLTVALGVWVESEGNFMPFPS